MVSDRKKQITLSIIGIFILIITILGVSYAVFNFVRNGSRTNQIYTGSVSFSFSEGNNGIYLTDQYPVESKDDVIKGATTDREKVSLTISANISSSTIYYKVFIYNPDNSTTTGSAARGLTMTDGVTANTSTYNVEKRLPDSCIALFIDSNTVTGISFNAAKDTGGIRNYSYDTGGKNYGAHIGATPGTRLLGATTNENNPDSKIMIGYGTVTEQATSANPLNLDVYAYIDSARCSIIENEEVNPNSYTSGEQRFFTQADYGGRYYSFKVRVEANTDNTNWNSESTKIKNFNNNTEAFSS